MKSLGLLGILFVWVGTMGMSSCSSIPYKDDVSFLNSSQSGSYEYPAYVAGKVCKDMDGNIGACVKQVSGNKAVNFVIDPQSYSYTLQFKCSKIGVSWDKDVPAGQRFPWSLPPESFSKEVSFTCEGEVFPHDRPNSDSAKFQIRILVVDPSYNKREVIHVVEGYLVLGQYAKFSRVCYSNQTCKRYKKETAVKEKGVVFAYSESERMRFNQWPR